ncbi:MAG TPA: N-methyl-L-tryptophan oxidase [Pirellulales bacterium]|nr:N-methyl-L-tryptophan oxidase [Pirellulales bacterium]
MYDAIVLGLGGIGSAAVYHLSGRGLRVLGLDQFGPGHALGSSHGQTRIIRQAYFEHPVYVPMAQQAFELWAELEARSGASLYQETGLLQIGAADGEVIAGVSRSAAEHRLEIERLTPDEAMSRFPGFKVLPDQTAVFERRAGYLRVEACVQAHLDEAKRRGAALRFEEPVRRWTAHAGGVEVESDRGIYRAERLMIAAGAWSSAALADLRLPLEVLRKPMLWYRPTGDDYRRERGTPCFLYEAAGHIYYGFPQIGPEGVKVAEHTLGLHVDDPSSVDRRVHDDDRQPVEAFISAYLPRLSSECTQSSVCMYTVTPDRNFIVDRHPRWPHVAIVAGLSGHGFKFAGVLGKALADLAVDGRCGWPVERFGLQRAALRS